MRKEVISQSLPLNMNSSSTISVQSQHPGMTHNKWYNPGRNKHDIIIAAIITQLFCTIIYLPRLPEMSEQRLLGDEDARIAHTVRPIFTSYRKAFWGQQCCMCVCFSPRRGWRRCKRERRERRDRRGNHLRRRRERRGRRRWKREVLKTSFKAPPER